MLLSSCPLSHGRRPWQYAAERRTASPFHSGTAPGRHEGGVEGREDRVGVGLVWNQAGGVWRNSHNCGKVRPPAEGDSLLMRWGGIEITQNITLCAVPVTKITVPSCLNVTHFGEQNKSTTPRTAISCPGSDLNPRHSAVCLHVTHFGEKNASCSIFHTCIKNHVKHHAVCVVPIT